MCFRKTSIMIALAACALMLGGCAHFGDPLGGQNETYYDEKSTHTEYETDATTGKRVEKSVTVDTTNVRGVTKAPPFGKITGEVGTVVELRADDSWILDTSGKADIDASGQIEAIKSLSNALAEVIKALNPAPPPPPTQDPEPEPEE